MNISNLQKHRYSYVPKLPSVLTNNINDITMKQLGNTTSVADAAKLKEIFKNNFGAPLVQFEKGSANVSDKIYNVAVILSGGQAPGGHNVIAGLFDAIKKDSTGNKLYGFLGGPSGLTDNQYIEINSDIMDKFRNTGGFDIIQSGRTKLESVEQYEQVITNCKKLSINAVVIIGGDDSNTNAALLAEYFADKKCGIQVIGCPKTIDGDLKNEQIETSFGFDTACKTYSELIGNIARDACSAKKYWHFIKLMGRSASHIGLECALQTAPNVTIISEEVEAKNMTLNDVVAMIAGSVITRAKNGNNYGIVLVPEGLIEFVPEIKVLISKLNNLLGIEADAFAKLTNFNDKLNWIKSKLDSNLASVYSSLPSNIQEQLIMDRDPHGNVQVSAIETEKMLITMVADYVKKNAPNVKFSGLGHFFGYEGRCAFPSNFDTDYCYALGFNTYLLIKNNLTGYISTISNLSKPVSNWVAGGSPLTMMMNIEERHGHNKPVIKKALVELDGAPFKELVKNRDKWLVESCYTYPGPIQYYGPDEVCNMPTITLALEQSK